MEEPVVESSHVAIAELGESPVGKLDVLIVIDDTPALAGYRERLAQVPALLADTLSRIDGGWHDIHVGVTGNDGRLRRLPDGSAYLVDARSYDYATHNSYVGSLADALATRLDVGTTYAGANRPLEAMRLALESSGEFVRDDAALAILMIGASDDASPAELVDYVAWTDRLARGSWNRRLVISAIYPQPAPRLDAYLKSFRSGARATIESIDSGDIAHAIAMVQETRWGGWGVPCIEAEPVAVADQQFACAMTARIGDALPAVPPCEVTAITDRADVSTRSGPSPACWRLVPDRMNCPYRSHLTLQLDGYTLTKHPAFRFECEIRTDTRAPTH